MKRKEKIKLLKAIDEGQATIEDLEPAQIYFFIHTSDKPGIYEMNGKQYCEMQYAEFCDRIKRKNNNSIIWHEGKEYPEKNRIITIAFPPEKICDTL